TTMARPAHGGGHGGRVPGAGVVPDAVLGVCTGIFDTLGASATSASLQLDRHWRNARTLATHDPAAFKVRMAGDHLVNGTPPTAYTSAGVVDDD
ncbi:hypothetical protein E4A41_09705, partial [Micrococcus endophyticus]